MPGIGSISVTNATKVTDTQYDVVIKFDIAFDWGGVNTVPNQAIYGITCEGVTKSEYVTFNVPSGNGSWRWTTIGTQTFRITLNPPTSPKTITFTGNINTGVNPPQISAQGSYTLQPLQTQSKVYYKNEYDELIKTILVTRYQEFTPGGYIDKPGYKFIGWDTVFPPTQVGYEIDTPYDVWWDYDITLWAVYEPTTNIFIKDDNKWHEGMLWVKKSDGTWQRGQPWVRKEDKWVVGL